MQTNATNQACAAFVEELIALESMQDNLNFMGEILKEYIAGDYGFNVKITIDGMDIKDEKYQRLLRECKNIKDERVKQKIVEHTKQNQDDRPKLILACLAMVLGMIFQASQMHYQYNNPQSKRREV